jgi:hypothetical protein
VLLVHPVLLEAVSAWLGCRQQVQVLAVHRELFGSVHHCRQAAAAGVPLAGACTAAADGQGWCASAKGRHGKQAPARCGAVLTCCSVVLCVGGCEVSSGWL